MIAQGRDILVTSDSLGDSLTAQICAKLANDTNGYQSLQRIGLLTSGTTGIPKIVVHDAERIALKARLNYEEVFRARHISRVACPLSLSFGHGLIGIFLTSIIYSEMVYLIKNELRDIVSIPAIVRSLSIDFLSSVPSIWKTIKLDDGALVGAHVGVGSAYLPRHLANQLLEKGCKSVLNFYGLTEMSNWIGYNETFDSADDLYDSQGNACFRLYPGVEWKLVEDADAQGHTNPDIGELALRHPTMLLGYMGHQFPDLSGGFYKTSDIMQRTTEEACLAMIGRSSMYVKRGGHRVHLTQIDSVISSGNIGVDTVTVNTSCSYKEEAVIVTLVESTDIEHLSIVENQVSAMLPESSHPNRYRLIDAIPKTARGKVDYISCTEFAKRNA